MTRDAYLAGVLASVTVYKVVGFVVSALSVLGDTKSKMDFIKDIGDRLVEAGENIEKEELHGETIRAGLNEEALKDMIAPILEDLLKGVVPYQKTDEATERIVKLLRGEGAT